jgi:hypothetical protein
MHTLRLPHMYEKPRGNRNLVSGPGTTEKLGCGLPRANKNNPRSAHTVHHKTALCFYLCMIWWNIYPWTSYICYYTINSLRVESKICVAHSIWNCPGPEILFCGPGPLITRFNIERPTIFKKPDLLNRGSGNFLKILAVHIEGLRQCCVSGSRYGWIRNFLQVPDP